MKKINWLSLLLAFAGAACMMGIGIFVASRSLFGIIASVVFMIVVMGLGFMNKKKMREKGLL